MKVHRLAKEQFGNFTHRVDVTHADLTETTADTDQTLELLAVAAGDLVKDACAKLVTPFEDASDTDFNDTQVSVGDGSDPDRFVTAAQVNENGTEVDYKAGVGTPYAYLAGDTIDLLVESMTGKSLSDLDAGEIHIYLEIVPLG